jgi:predicted RNA-binding Zn ribbon-like protein
VSNISFNARSFQEFLMLVKFNSSISGEMIMLAETAKRLLEIIGKARSARGVITTEQLPDALARLRNAVAEEKTGQRDAGTVDNGYPDPDDETAAEPPVGLARRAHPFIEMLEWTQREEGFVLWEAPADF